MKFIRRVAHAVVDAVKKLEIVICRKDLPRNPRWREEGYPYENCWSIDELMSEAVKAGRDSELYREARRIWWEAYWRRLGRYRRGRPFFEAYIKRDSVLEPLTDREFVINNIIVAGFEWGLVPREALIWTYKIYKPLFAEARTA